MSCLTDSLPNKIKTFEPAIGCCLIANPTPNAFLDIQTRLITWQVLQTQPPMGLQEQLHVFSHVPSGSIHIQPDRIAAEPAIELSETSQKSLSVPLRIPHQTFPTQQRSNPAEDVESGAMLAGSGDPYSLPFLCPPDPQTRVEGEACFILENDGLSGPQRAKFFLEPSGISSLPYPVPEDRSDWLVSADSPADASNFEPGGPSTLSQSGVSGASQGLDHPNGHDSTRTLEGTSLSVVLIPDKSAHSGGQVARAFVWAVRPLSLAHSPCASRRLSSDASGLRPRLSIPDADPPISAIEPQPLPRHGLPGLAEQEPLDALGSLLDALTLEWDFSWG